VAVNTVLAYHSLDRTTHLHVIHPLLTLGAYLRCATRCSPIAASRVFAYTLTRRHTLAQMMPQRSCALLPQRTRRKCPVTINIAADYFSNWVPGRRVTCRKPREDSRCGSLARTGAQAVLRPLRGASPALPDVESSNKCLENTAF